MLQLYHSPYSTCSQKVRLCLWEKNLPFEPIELDFSKAEHLTPEYLALNPNGVVPTLVHDGAPVTESSVIVEYLDDVFPDVPMTPDTALERARMRAWLRFLDEVPTTAIRVPSFNKVFVKLWRNKSDSEVDEQIESRTIRKGMYREMGREGFDQAKYDDSVDRLRLTLDRMERALEKTEWLCGERMMLPDICVIPTIDRMEDLGMSDLWSDAPNVQRWWTAVKARPSFAKTFHLGSRVSDRFEIDP